MAGAERSCPCGSGESYHHCCEPYHQGSAIAPTAEALMRSRYAAFCQGQIDYLVATLHPDSRRPDDRRSLRQTIQSTQWVGLTILKTQKGQAQDHKGIVEFVAAYREGQAAGFGATAVKQLHERSRFVKSNSQWFYVDGDILPPVKL
jgi:SEC-C motif domain protein